MRVAAARAVPSRPAAGRRRRVGRVRRIEGSFVGGRDPGHLRQIARQANGRGSPIIETAFARDAVSRRRWCWRQSTSYPTSARGCRRALDVADHDHVALGDHLAVLGAGVVGGPLAAPAQRLDLEHVHPVGELDQPRGAGEHRGPEVGEDAEREHVHLELVDDAGQLLDLRGRVELGLVADQVVDPAALRERVDDVLPEVERRRRPRWPRAGGPAGSTASRRRRGRGW